MEIVASSARLLGNLVVGRRFDVPEIQRPYAFAIDNNDDAEASSAGATFLKNDLISFHRIVDNTERNYFLGSIIIESETGIDDEEAVFDLLDGQQRMTTLSLLINEIYRSLVEVDDYEEFAVVELLQNWLVYDSAVFTAPEPGWTYCLYPRRETDRTAYQLAMQGADLEHFPNGNIRDVVEDFRAFVESEFDGPEDLAAFAETLLERVEIMILCVPNTAMAFQMFQTANARGTPLSQLDMFRSTVVMQARTVLDLNRNRLAGIQNALQEIERDFTDKYDDEKARSTKIDQMMKYWMWIRRGDDSGGVSFIMKMVEDCQEEDDLRRLVIDLSNHVSVWCNHVDLSCSNIPENNPLHPLFPKITQGWKMYYLAVRTARLNPNARRRLTHGNEQRLLNLMMWWYLIEYSHDGEGNTTRFRSEWAKLAHRTWQHSQFGDPLLGWSNQNLLEFVENKFNGFEFTVFPLAKQNQDTFKVNHSNLKPFQVILGMFERIGDTGLGPARQGSNTRDVSIVHLVNPDFLPTELAYSVGNFTLVRGSNSNGPLVRDLTDWSNETLDTPARLLYLNGLMSLSSRTEDWPELNQMNDLRMIRQLVTRRNEAIIGALNGRFNLICARIRAAVEGANGGND